MKHNTTVQKTYPLILLTIPKAVWYHSDSEQTPNFRSESDRIPGSWGKQGTPKTRPYGRVLNGGGRGWEPAAEEREGHHKRVLMDAFLVSEGRGKGMGASKYQNVPIGARFWCLAAEEKPRTPKTRPHGRVFGVRMDGRRQGGGGGGGVGTASGLGIS